MKIYIVDKLKDQLLIADKIEQFTNLLWGRDIKDFIIIISTKRGDFHYDYRIGLGDMGHIERFIKQYE